jgi:hypothetical protein
MFGKVTMTDQTPAPSPPDSIPNYVADGLKRQGIPVLRAVIQYCEELIAHLEEPPEDLEADDDVVDVEDADGSGGTIVKKMVKCGSDCECNDGQGHGPYKYRVQRDGSGGQDWEYIGKA